MACSAYAMTDSSRRVSRRLQLIRISSDFSHAADDERARLIRSLSIGMLDMEDGFVHHE